MARRDDIERIKLGIAEWNAWRRPPFARPDLSQANLGGAELGALNLSRVDLWQTNFLAARLDHADFSDADLMRANLGRATLDHAILDRSRILDCDLSGCRAVSASFRQVHGRRAHFNSAMLDDADFTGAQLPGADLSNVAARRAVFREANLVGAVLRNAEMEGADFTDATFGDTLIDGIDLKSLVGLDRVRHVGPSAISIQTIRTVAQPPPYHFFFGIGLNEVEMLYLHMLDHSHSHSEIVNIAYEMISHSAKDAIEISPIFLSYSHVDTAFVDCLQSALTAMSVRCWRDAHDLRAGRLERQLDQAIRLNPTVVLVLSEKSVKSDWVRWEAATARKLETQLNRDVLCPVSLDEAWKTCDWPGPLRQQIADYVVLDFADWRDPSKFELQFQKLLAGLRIDY